MGRKGKESASFTFPLYKLILLLLLISVARFMDLIMVVYVTCTVGAEARRLIKITRRVASSDLTKSRSPRGSLIPQCIVPSWWRHQMETFSSLLAICAGNSLHKGQWPSRPLWRHRNASCFNPFVIWTRLIKSLYFLWKGLGSPALARW